MFCKNRLSAGISGLHSLNAGRSILPTVLAAAALLLLTDSRDAFAGTGGEEFADVWDTLKEWIQGTLGRVICGSMILVGIVAGVARQSISAFAIGIGGGIGLYNTPTVIESVLSATVSTLNEKEIGELEQHSAALFHSIHGSLSPEISDAASYLLSCL